MISLRSLATLGKNCKQKFKHKTFQSPWLLPTWWLYQRLAFPVKENGKSFYLKVSLDMPSMLRHA
jgi:hypothetical protein